MVEHADILPLATGPEVTSLWMKDYLEAGTCRTLIFRGMADSGPCTRCPIGKCTRVGTHCVVDAPEYVTRDSGADYVLPRPTPKDYSRLGVQRSDNAAGR